MRWLCAALILIAGLRAAAAEIRIDESRYERGIETVTGLTGPHLTVTLDGKFETQSDAGGRFTFSVKEKPPTCMSDIRAGDDVYSAVIAGCLDPGDTEMPLPPQQTAVKPAH